MSNVSIRKSTGHFSTEGFTLYELDEVPGVEVLYSGSLNERKSIVSASFTYYAYGTDKDDKPLCIVNHMRESPYGSGLYFNAYKHYIGTGSPKFTRNSRDWGDGYATVATPVTSGHFEYFFEGDIPVVSCYVGPISRVYYLRFVYPPCAGVYVETIYRGNLIIGSANREIDADMWLRYKRGLKSGELESYLQNELLIAQRDLENQISRTTKEGYIHSVAEEKFAVPKFDFKLNEYNDFQCIRDLELIPNRMRMVAGNAYINACQNLPKTANNTLQNVIEVIDTIRSIKSGNLGKAATSFINSSAYEGAKSAWLMYRYQYNTTKMDFEEYKNLIFRLKDLQKLSKITIHGEFAWGGYQCHCSFDVNACDFIPHTLNEFLRASGLYFKTADIWDDIPFSFIVDWFLHLGDALTWLDTHEDAWNVRPSNVWYSWETSYDDQTCYIRAPGEPIVNAPYLQCNNGTSAKVKAMRFADVISIFL